MPFIDAAGAWLLRASRRVAWLEHLLAIAGWLIGPLSLITLAGTGELMAHGGAAQGLPSFATLRGMHVLAGATLIVLIAYHAARVLFRWARHGVPFISGPHWRTWLGRERMAANWTAWLVRAGGWGCLLLLLATGLVRHLRLRYGWSPVPPGEPAWWDVLHVAAAPYLYGFLLLEGYLRLRRWLPALRAYLVRQY